jgi:hypothetical protein
LQAKADRNIYHDRHNQLSIAQPIKKRQRRHGNDYDDPRFKHTPTDHAAVYIEGRITQPEWNFA